MSLLTELNYFFAVIFYKYAAPTALKKSADNFSKRARLNGSQTT
jgi:hypothetical protein